MTTTTTSFLLYHVYNSFPHSGSLWLCIFCYTQMPLRPEFSYETWNISLAHNTGTNNSNSIRLCADSRQPTAISAQLNNECIQLGTLSQQPASNESTSVALRLTVYIFQLFAFLAILRIFFFCLTDDFHWKFVELFILVIFLLIFCVIKSNLIWVFNLKNIINALKIQSWQNVCDFFFTTLLFFVAVAYIFVG